jgi:undecaprenyl-diphosphatase
LVVGFLSFDFNFLDYYFLHLLNQYALKSAILDGIAVFFANWSGYLVVAAFLVFLWRKRAAISKKAEMFASCFLPAVISRLGITVLIRYLYYRPRPYLTDAVNILIDKSREASFPSGHAAFFFAFSLAVYYQNKKWGAVFMALSVLMGLARIFVGVHWPSDILAGAVVGFLSVWLVRRFRCFR